MKKRIALLIAFSVSLPFAAQAQQARRSPLLDAPAVRNRVEMRDMRFELGAGVGAQLNPAYYNAIMLNVRLAFHLNDWLGISAMGSFNLTKNMRTTLANELHSSLEQPSAEPRSPSHNEAFSSMNRIDYMIGAHLEATPFTGKFGLFGKLFANYDFYMFLGPGFATLSTPDWDPAFCEQGPCGPVKGTKVGLSFGVGMHTFFNKVIALDIALRDMMFKDNPAGRDVNGDKLITTSDQSFMSHYMATLGLTFYLPPDAKVY